MHPEKPEKTYKLSGFPKNLGIDSLLCNVLLIPTLNMVLRHTYEHLLSEAHYRLNAR